MSRLEELVRSSRLFAFNLVNRDAWIARQASSVRAGSRVLDVGAGSCVYRPLFSHCEYKTQDSAALNGNLCRTGGYGEIDYVGDATSIPVPDGAFDTVLCTEVLEHVPDPVAVIHELARILKPDGKLILTAPLGSGLHQEPHHYYGGFTPYWYRKFLAEAGFGEITIEPNAGFFAFYVQESLRFLKLSAPTHLRAPIFAKCIWTPLWLILLPVLGGFIPLIGHWLDGFEMEQKFTVGYHVTASKG
jgi:SAM-dependent methyltransferase